MSAKLELISSEMVICKNHSSPSQISTTAISTALGWDWNTWDLWISHSSRWLHAPTAAKRPPGRKHRNLTRSRYSYGDWSQRNYLLINLFNTILKFELSGYFYSCIDITLGHLGASVRFKQPRDLCSLRIAQVQLPTCTRYSNRIQRSIQASLESLFPHSLIILVPSGRATTWISAADARMVPVTWLRCSLSEIAPSMYSCP